MPFSFVLTGGGTVITLPSQKFSAIELFNEVDRLRASSISIVGLSFAAPMLETLNANPDKWDLTCLRAIGSSGETRNAGRLAISLDRNATGN